MKSGKPTIHTVAQATGLSLATVSRALAGSASVTIATREKVLEAARRLNYVRDRTAVRLKTGRTLVIAFIMDRLDVMQPAFESLLRGLGDALATTDYHLIVLPDAASADGLEAIRYVVERGMADGLVFSHTSPDDARVRYLHEQQFPFITHGRTDWSFVHPSVDFANEAFAADAVRALVRRGRQRPAILLPRPGGMFREHLQKGFVRACAELGLAGQVVTETDLNEDPDLLHAWTVKHANDFDGLVISLEAPALVLLSALAQAGRQIGRDVDVVLKHSSNMPRYLREPILTCFEDVHEAGLTLGLSLLEQLRDPQLRPKQILFSPPPIEEPYVSA